MVILFCFLCFFADDVQDEISIQSVKTKVQSTALLFNN